MSGSSVLITTPTKQNSLCLRVASLVNLFIDWPIDNLLSNNSPGQRIILSQAISEPDEDEDLDGCDVEVGEGDKTNDEDLPITQGGVA